MSNNVLPPRGPAVRLISGRQLHRSLRRIPYHHRVRLALELAAGRLRICDLSLSQSARLAGVSVSSIGRWFNQPTAITADNDYAATIMQAARSDTTAASSNRRRLFCPGGHDDRHQDRPTDQASRV
jgi:hypothetical protein